MINAKECQLFSKDAFGTMLAVDKWRDDGDAHVKRLARSASQRCRGQTEFSQAWVDCITGPLRPRKRAAGSSNRSILTGLVQRDD